MLKVYEIQLYAFVEIFTLNIVNNISGEVEKGAES